MSGEKRVDDGRFANEDPFEHPIDHPRSSDDEDAVSTNAQAGVQKIEAATVVWTKTSLIVAYVMIWFIYFINSFEQGTMGMLTPWVTSAFSMHSLTAATGIMSGIIAGVFKLTLAKILDVWGRPQGYAVSVVILTIGIIMMAACPNVETYAAAQVFYWMGYNGLVYSINIFVADTSALKNRGLMFAFASSPYIITMWMSSPTAASVLAPGGPGFRWGFGIFAIVTPIMTMPLFGLLVWNTRKAKKMGVLPPRPDSGRTTLQSLKHYAVQFDVVGLFLLSVGIALFLLPFSLYSKQPSGWKSPMIIAFIVVGGLLIVAFACWERWWAPVKFLPYELLTDRTVLCSCILAACTFISFYLWDSYLLSWLQVVNGLDVTKAGYVYSIYSIGSCLWSFIVGIAIRYTGRFKWVALFFGVPMTILGVALMLAFRRPDVNVGYIVMCQIFIAVAGGAIVICEQVAIMAAVPHQYVAVVLAIEAMFTSIGGAIGQTVSTAIWTGVFPGKLEHYLPEAEKANAALIYGSLEVQLSYPWGSPARRAIQQAYGDTQKLMLIAATCVLCVALLSVALWRDINVKERKQVKGLVI